jgi:hypothetical protein
MAVLSWIIQLSPWDELNAEDKITLPVKRPVMITFATTTSSFPWK